MKREQALNKVRILHTGDIHLDSAFSRAGVRGGEERRAELRSVFSDLMKYVKNGKIDVLLIAGDLFDTELATSETLELLVREFSSCRIPIFIAPGNHDPYTANSIYSFGKFPKNVHIFKEKTLSSVYIENLNTEVYGWAFEDISHGFSPIADKHVEKEGCLNLVCGHAQLDNPLTEYCPVTKRDIESFGADYYAFGHVHLNPEQKKVGDASYAYSGFLLGRSFDECGAGGAWLIEAEEKEGGGYEIETKRLTFGQHIYESITVNIDGSLDTPAIERKIREEIKRLGLGGGCSLRVTLKGAVSLSFSTKELEGCELGVDYVEYKNRTTPAYGAEELKNDMTIKGELYRYLLPILEEGSASERETALRALKIGLAALDGRDITTQTEV
ncbi:MAG: DNA repair exonuclease [Clostridia bacterium]|jgi:DNA repair exonuclease SbcCD nuclease subunit|nr:DNA repair exonuclease [Clostridia bacterium]